MHRRHPGFLDMDSVLYYAKMDQYVCRNDNPTYRRDFLGRSALRLLNRLSDRDIVQQRGGHSVFGLCIVVFCQSFLYTRDSPDALALCFSEGQTASPHTPPGSSRQGRLAMIRRPRHGTRQRAPSIETKKLEPTDRAALALS